MLGNIEGSRRRGRQRMRWLGGITDLMDEFEQASGVGDGQGGLACRSQRGSREWERLSDRTRTKREEVEAQRRSDWPGVHRRGWQIWDPTEVAWLQSPSSSPLHLAATCQGGG